MKIVAATISSVGVTGKIVRPTIYLSWPNQSSVDLTKWIRASCSNYFLSVGLTNFFFRVKVESPTARKIPNTNDEPLPATKTTSPSKHSATHQIFPSPRQSDAPRGNPRTPVDNFQNNTNNYRGPTILLSCAKCFLKYPLQHGRGDDDFVVNHVYAGRKESRRKRVYTRMHVAIL